MPIASQSIQLFKNIGFPSYQKHLKDVKKIYLIAPKKDIPLLDFCGEPYVILDERNFLHSSMDSVRGWYKQQIIKLTASLIVDTPEYLILDGDHFLVKDLHYSDLKKGDKVAGHFEPFQTLNSVDYSVNSKWWECSVKLLNIQNFNEMKRHLSVTPQIVITNYVKDLISELQEKSEFWEVELCNGGFTEFTLYWLYLYKRGLDHLYFESDLWKHDREVNLLTTEENEKVVETAKKEQRTFFSVLQGYLINNPSQYIKIYNPKVVPSHNDIFLVASMVRPTIQRKFTVEERLQQTLRTVKSIRERVNNVTIICIEGSDVEEYKEAYSVFDHTIHCSKHEEVDKYVTAQNIGHGEMKLLQIGLKFIYHYKLQPSRIFKLGARYELTNDFNIDSYSKEKYTFRKHIDYDVMASVVTTGLYSIPLSKLESFHNILNQHDVLDRCGMIERLFLELIPEEEIHFIDTLGVTGQLSYDGRRFSV